MVEEPYKHIIARGRLLSDITLGGTAATMADRVPLRYSVEEGYYYTSMMILSITRTLLYMARCG